MDYLRTVPKEQPWKAFVNHSVSQTEAHLKHEAFRNQATQKPWNEWLQDYMGILAAPKTPAPPVPEQ